MAINIAIDDALISEAQKAGKFKTKKETVTAALREFIQRRKQEEKIVGLFGTLDYDPGYDHKDLRNDHDGAHPYARPVQGRRKQPKTGAEERMNK